MKLMASVLLSAFASSVMLTATTTPRHLPFITENNAITCADKSSLTESATSDRLSIINDDFERARAEANKRNLPLFVEVWAPW